MLSARSPPQSPSAHSLTSPSSGGGLRQRPLPFHGRDSSQVQGQTWAAWGSSSPARGLSREGWATAGTHVPPRGWGQPSRGTMARPTLLFAPQPSLGSGGGHLGKPDAQASLTQALPADPFQGPSWALGGWVHDALRGGEQRSLSVWPAPLMLTQKCPFQRALYPWVICGSCSTQDLSSHKPVEYHSLTKNPQSQVSVFPGQKAPPQKW